jgi:hypothetical protein
LFRGEIRFRNFLALRILPLFVEGIPLPMQPLVLGGNNDFYAAINFFQLAGVSVSGISTGNLTGFGKHFICLLNLPGKLIWVVVNFICIRAACSKKKGKCDLPWCYAAGGSRFQGC